MSRKEEPRFLERRGVIARAQAKRIGENLVRSWCTWCYILLGVDEVFREVYHPWSSARALAHVTRETYFSGLHGTTGL